MVTGFVCSFEQQKFNKISELWTEGNTTVVDILFWLSVELSMKHKNG